MSEWGEYKLEQIAEVIDSLHKTPKYEEFGFPMVRVTDIKPGFLNLSNTFKVTQETYEEFSKKYKAKKGDIVFSRVGSYGITALVNSDEPFCLGQNTAFIVPFKCNPYFLYYFLNSPIGKSQIEGLVAGSTQPTVSLQSIKEILVHAPLLKEQESIAAILSSLDNKIDLLRRQNQTLEQLAQTIFKQWFVLFQYPDANGKMQQTELGEVPEGWRIGKFMEVIKLLSGGTPKTDTPEYWNGNIPWISAKDVTANHSSFIMTTEKYITEEGVNNSATKLLPKYTTVISARGTVGCYCILSEPMCISQSNYGIKSRIDNTDFYAYLLTENIIDSLKSKAYGSVFDTITTSTFEATDIIIPPIETINKFESSISPLLQKKFNNSKEIQTLTQLRDSLLPRLMSGRLRVG